MIWHSVDGEFGMQNKAAVPSTLVAITERTRENSTLRVLGTRETVYQVSDDCRYVTSHYFVGLKLTGVIIARMKSSDLVESLETPGRFELAKEWLLCRVIGRSTVGAITSFTPLKPDTFVFVPLRKGKSRKLDITLL